MMDHTSYSSSMVFMPDGRGCGRGSKVDGYNRCARVKGERLKFMLSRSPLTFKNAQLTRFRIPFYTTYIIQHTVSHQFSDSLAG